MTTKKITILTTWVLFVAGTITGISQEYEEDYIPLPQKVVEVAESKIDLGGSWKFSLTPPNNFWEQSTEKSSWDDIEVPGEIRTQGYDIELDIETAYYKEITVPEGFKDKKVLLRFEGVYNYTRVWVNGNFVREHYGGFAPWHCDITKWIKAGEPLIITLGVTDRADDISMASDYAKHIIGGILRDVYLVALPQTYLTNLKIDTDFDSAYKDAELILQLEVHSGKTKKSEVSIELLNPSGNKVELPRATFKVGRGSNSISESLRVEAPLKWDAEHPNLYTLNLSLKSKGKIVETVAKKIGFREIEQRGKNVFVNGKEIKLRGADHHSTHPLNGRVVTREMEKRDVLLAKEANMNFLRTSHYPPTQAFLEYCDEYGIYVEDETAVTFIDVNHTATQNNPEFTDRYLGQLKEMVWADYNHPSVIMWSIANESVHGSNFQLSYDWLKKMDKQRLVAFSYPSTVKDKKSYDVISIHYPHFDKITEEVTGLFDPKLKKRVPYVREDLPVLFDEWAHVPAYNVKTIKEDPNVRDFWGHSIKAMWDQSFNEDGILGGAIWCMIDDVFVLPKTEKDTSQRVSKFGTGEWGIVDSWRRKKPEFWHTRKGYSPIYIKDKVVKIDTNSSAFQIKVQNRFDHTNFNELSIKWKLGGKSGQLQNVDIEPHAKGMLVIPAPAGKDIRTLELTFFRDNSQIDEFKFDVIDATKVDDIASKQRSRESTGLRPMVDASDTELKISSNDFQIVFDTSTGLISEGVFNSNKVIVNGPHLQIAPIELGDWALKNLSHEEKENEVIVSIVGQYDAINVNYRITINGEGRLTTEFEIMNPPPPPPNGDEWWPRNGYREVGIAYLLDGSINRNVWKREALWSTYPENHIGRGEGIAKRISNKDNKSDGIKPDWEFSEDMQNVYTSKDAVVPFGATATNDFRATKENIYYAHVYAADAATGVTVEGDGSQAIRLEATSKKTDSPIKMHVNVLWDYPNLGWGCYMKNPISIPENYNGKIILKPYLQEKN